MRRIAELLFTIFALLLVINLCLTVWDVLRWRLNLAVWSLGGLIASGVGLWMTAREETR